MYGLFATSQQVNKAATRLCAIWLTCNKAVRHMAHLQQGCAPYGSLAQGRVPYGSLTTRSNKMLRIRIRLCR